MTGKNQHINWTNDLSHIRPSEAEKAIGHLLTGCEFCLWELNSNENQSHKLIDTVKCAKIKTDISCPMQDQLILFSILALDHSSLIEVAAHVANCKLCYDTLYLNKGIAHKTASFVQEITTEATKNALNEIRYENIKTHLMLTLIDSQGNIKYQFPYRKALTGSRFLRRYTATIEEGAIDWILFNSCTIQLLDKSGKVFSDPEIGSVVIKSNTEKNSHKATRILHSIETSAIERSLITERLSMASNALDQPSEIFPHGLRIVNASKQKWTFKTADSEKTIIVSVDDEDDNEYKNE